MKEKIKRIMVKGGFSVIIAVVAMAAYLFVMYFANKYFYKVTEPAKVVVNENGEVSIEGFEKEEEEIIYILWETDGGSIKPAKENPVFDEQNNKENNKWYYANTNIDEAVVWNSTDADGNEYSTATIRAVIYSYNKDDGKDQYYMGNYVNQMNITVTKKDGKIIQAEEERYFSNPVRADGNSQWTQIYIIDEDKDGLQTYRFRTGQEIDDDILILCWESEEPVLAETNYEIGLYPYCQILNSDKNQQRLIAKSTVTIDKKKAGGTSISAYLIDENTYDNYEDTIANEDKLYKADLMIQ